MFVRASSSHQSKNGHSTNVRPLTGVVHNDMLGIHEFIIRGSIQGSDGSLRPIVPLVTLKWLPINDTFCRMRGVILVNIPENHPVIFGESFRSDNSWLPQISLVTDEEHKEKSKYDLKLASTQRVPYLIEHDALPCFTDKNKDSIGLQPLSYEFVIHNWVSNTRKVLTPATTMFVDHSSMIFRGNKSFHSLLAFTDFEVKAEDIKYHMYNLASSVNYNDRQGFTNSLFYLNGKLFAYLYRMPAFLHLLRSKKLFVYVFSGMPMYPRDLYAWREYIFNHARLAAWGNDVYLTALDRDEVLAIPYKTTLYEMVTTGCLKDLSYVDLIMAIVLHPKSQANRVADKLVLEEMEPRIKKNFFSQYTLTCMCTNKTLCNPKGIFHPEGTLWNSIHDGRVRPGYKTAYVSSECAYHAHARNFWRFRMDNEKARSMLECSIQNDTKWLYMYDSSYVPSLQ
jgi:hypothetical protein